jgi:CheY-like chemotaxis protein
MQIGGMPINLSADSAVATSKTSRMQEIPKSVLVVENDRWTRFSIAERLRASGYIVYEASNGFTGLHLAEREHPDVLLLDMALPELSGCEVLDALKADRTARDIPAIAISTWPEPPVHGGVCHANAAIAKPVDLETLAGSVRALVGLRAVMSSPAT